MSTSNKIVINEVPDTIYIPQEAVFHKDDKHFVFVKNGSSFDEKFVKIGDKSEDFIIISEGLEDKDIVALRNPREETGKSEQKKNGVSLPSNGK